MSDQASDRLREKLLVDYGKVDFSDSPLLVLLKDYIEDRSVLDCGALQHSPEQIINSDKTWHHGFIKHFAKTCVGVDLEKDYIKTLKKDYGLDLVFANVQEMDLKRRFEIVTALDIIEHLENPGLFLVNIEKHLTDGGRLILTTPNSFDFGRLVRSVLRFFDNDPNCHAQHTAWYSPRVITTLLERCGFEVERIDYFSHWKRWLLLKKLISLITNKSGLATMFVVARVKRD